MGSNVKIQNLEVKVGKVISVSLSGDAIDLFTMAIGEVETAQANTKHMQRPLARKFTSLIAKMKVQAEAFAAMMVADKATKPELFDFGDLGM